MKIYKKNHLSLLVKIFGLGDVLYLTTTILVYFDLNDPNQPLQEQDLWRTIPELLGEQALDMGFPKPRGEYLVTGKCFAPKGEKRPASQVGVRVGPLSKTLDVFGDRYWLDSQSSRPMPSDPEPFSEMPLDYSRAYGGEGFAFNPKGLGAIRVDAIEGRQVHPLPNVELHDHLISNPDDVPPPAGFGPLDFMWPPRHDKVGTYDDKWLRERWPWFPDDIDPEFFNTAPENQFLDGYFQGGEVIEITNMHPDIPVIQSRVPSHRIRCFVTQMKKPGAPPEEDMFREVGNHVDTVWLFPEILRGVAMYRGTLEVQDDEFADIRRIFLASENPSDEPLSIEHYRDEQEKAADLSVPFDPAPIKMAHLKMNRAAKKIRAIPKELDVIKKQALGKAPRMQRSMPEVHQITKNVIFERLADLDKMEASSRALHADYGHKVKINLDMFDHLRGKLKGLGSKIDNMMATLAKAQEELGAAPDDIKGKLAEAMTSMVPPEMLEEAGLEGGVLPDPETEAKPWHDEGFAFVLRCRKNLEKDQETRRLLDKLGFENRTVKRAWLGINPEEASFDPVAWGLEPQNPDAGREGPLVIPPGLVIPRFDDAELKRIIVRTGEYQYRAGEVVVEGSDKTPQALLIDNSAPVVIVPDDLAAWRVEEEIGDLCSVIAANKPGELSDDPAAAALDQASGLLVVLPASKADSEADWAPWKDAFENAIKMPLPKTENVFDAYLGGLDIRQWILTFLPQEMARDHIVEPYEPEPGAPPGPFKLPKLPISADAIKDMVNKTVAEIQAGFLPMKDEMIAKQQEIRESVKGHIAKAGLDPEKVLAQIGDSEKKSFADGAKIAADKMAKDRATLKDGGLLPPEVEAKMKAAEEKIRQDGQKAEAMWQKGQAQMAEGREKIAAAKAKAQSGELPPAAKKKLLLHGIDMDKRRRLTREEVIEMHGRGESLDQAIISGLDLSELDLSGINLSKANCKGTVFAKSNLDGADFTQAIAKGADFSECSLVGAKFHKGLFMAAVFKKANLNQSDFEQALLKKADFTEADLASAEMSLSIMSTAKLNGASLAGANLKLCIVDAVEAAGADFSRCRFSQCIFKKSVLDDVKFVEAVLDMTLFYGSSGGKVNFSGANLDKSRMGGNCAFPGADFRNASMHEVCYRDSDLAGSAFDGAEMQNSILENCDLTRSSFTRTIAKKCRLIKSDLEGANMKTINLFQGSLRKSRLVNTDLRASNLFAVDFYKAVFGETQLDMANIKRTLIDKKTDLLK